MHLDCAERLKRFGQSHPEADWEGAAGNVGRAIAFIEKNVYLPLVLMSIHPQFGTQ
jgi:hypothetical protein